MTTRTAPDLARLDGAVLDALHGRSMLLTQDWTTAEIDTLCALAEGLQSLDRLGRVPALFPQELFWALFFDQSTRTKSSWGGAATRLGVAYTTAQRAIETLMREGVLSPASAARRDRVFVAKAILDILEEPARLVPDGENRARRRGGTTKRE